MGRAKAQDRTGNQRSDMRDQTSRQDKLQMWLFSRVCNEEVLNLLESWTLESLKNVMSQAPKKKCVAAHLDKVLISGELSIL